MSKRTLASCLLVSAVLTAGACTTHQEAAAPIAVSGGAASGEHAPAAAPATPTVDDCGSYQPDVELPASHCERDEDCTWTPLRPGDCTAPLCSGHYRAGTKAWVAALEVMHERICGNARWNACERVKCIHTKPEGARCVNGDCEPVFPDE